MSNKVFVGNLAFRTTDQALQEAFSKYGDVKSGVIITRGRRSLGYGFVEFTSAEEAVSAVEKMNRVEIFGRQVKVEIAKDPAEREPGAPSGGDRERGGEGGEPGPARRRRRAPRGENDDEGTATTTSTSHSHGHAHGSGDHHHGGSDKAHEGDGDRAPRRRRQRKPRDGDAEGGGEHTGHEHVSAPPAKPKEKVPSKTTLFVANLPFSIDDEQLLKLFSDTKVKAAHVVRTRTGRSRGYGFVEFENEADQTAALNTTNGREVVGVNGNRNISVTISNSVASTQPGEPTTH